MKSIRLRLQGPVFTEPLVTPPDAAKLNAIGAVDRLKYVGDAITMMRHKLEGKVPLIGFSGAPVKCFNVTFQQIEDIFIFDIRQSSTNYLFSFHSGR